VKLKYFIAGVFLSCFIIDALAQNSGDYNVTLSIGNVAPTVLVYAHANVNPVQNGITNTEFVLLLSDLNLIGDLNTTSINLSLTNGAVTHLQQSCYNQQTVTTTSINITCNVSLNYYDVAGSWAINASVKDNSNGLGYNDTSTVTYNTLTAMGLGSNSITFGSLSLGQTAGATNDPLVVYNQGNSNINNVSVKGYSLAGGTSSLINCSLINVTTTDSSGTGTPMANDTMKQLPTVTINRGSGASQNLYLWITVPSSGLETASYASQSSWVVAAYVN